MPKLKEPNVSEYKYSYTCKKYDIDVNGHMHNLNYINLAYETLPEDIYSFDFRNIEILYKKQIKTGDIVDCLYSKLEDSNIITIKNKETNSTNAILKIF